MLVENIKVREARLIKLIEENAAKKNKMNALICSFFIDICTVTLSQ
jgi:hypothetical protein